MKLNEAIGWIDTDAAVELQINKEFTWRGPLENLKKRFEVLKLTGDEKVYGAEFRRGRIVLKI